MAVMLDYYRLSISDVIVINAARHGDSRGFFSETYHRDALAQIGVNVTFVQDNHSLSVARHTLRGLHTQFSPYDQGKLVRVTRGRIFDVAVDIRQDSETFGRWVCAEISAERWNQIYIPPGFLHGFMTLEDHTEVQYKVTSYYHRESEAGVLWNDPELKIDWPQTADVSLSEKDAQLPGWSEFKSLLGKR